MAHEPNQTSSQQGDKGAMNGEMEADVVSQ
ncbi:uncharacterized protein G2W53_032689 [Senna tora]|uniref:Uncharacterized protein n=1 Tax=Senna tora TaxID=362788 RepID=A0A834W7V6_9FABA|nr:uncharacterized protein G2W53_032689 [Senna tora]